MSADGVQAILGEVSAARSSLDYLEDRLHAVRQAIDDISRIGWSGRFQRVQDSGIRSVQSPCADEAHSNLQSALHHIEAATRYIDTWLGEVLVIIDL